MSPPGIRYAQLLEVRRSCSPMAPAWRSPRACPALAHNVNGTDLFRGCALPRRLALPVAFLGARPGVAAACAARMQHGYPGLEVAWVADGYLRQEEEQLLRTQRVRARLLFVAKGVPAQELWIAAHAAQLAAPVMLGVGALFDFYSGAIPRAPAFMRQLRLEWLYRLVRSHAACFAATCSATLILRARPAVAAAASD